MIIDEAAAVVAIELNIVKKEAFYFQLYDLMIMAVKHQVLMSQNPRHLIMITLNHLVSIAITACYAKKLDHCISAKMLWFLFNGLAFLEK